MHELSDRELLANYSRHGTESAFAELARRHVDLVYSAALRQVGVAAHAEEITQAVFMILAQKAARLRPDTLLEAWLYQTARLTAQGFLRSERRRQRREQEAYMESNLHESSAPPVWNQLAPLLENAMARLPRTDREAVLLRYFKGRNFSEVATAMKITEAAAQSRVHRALRKLQKYLRQRGIDSTTSAIGATLSTHAIQTAPLGLAKSACSVALAKSATISVSTSTLVKGTLKIMAWTKMKTAAVTGAAVLLLAGTATIQESRWHQTDSWRTKGIDHQTITGLANPPSQVWVKPAKNTHLPNQLGSGTNGMLLGRNVPLTWLMRDAYGKTQPWMIFKEGLADGPGYDFMANLSSGSREALQREINRTLGISVRHQVVETNVVLLQIGPGGVRGLESPDFTAGDMRVEAGKITWPAKPLTTLDVFLEGFLDLPIVDQTGLTGTCKYAISWDENWWREDADRSVLKLNPVLLDQLGLQLVSTNLPIEMLVVEKAR